MNKLTKVLSIFVIAGAIGTGVAGVAGCKKTPKHDCDQSLVYVDDANGSTHHQECSQHPDYKKNEGELHVDEGNDGICDVCGGEIYASAVVTGVTVSGLTSSTVGTPVQLTATVTGAAGVAQTVTWTITEGSDIATISESGLLTATGAGTVKVKATSTVDITKSSEVYTVTFHEVNAAADPEGVNLDTHASTSSVGRTFDIVATITNAAELSAEKKVLSWEVDDEDIAVIDSVSDDTATATVRVTGVGETTITVTTVNGKSAVYELTAENPAKGINSITLDGKTVDRIHLTSDDASLELVADVDTGNSVKTSDTVVWTVSNSAVLSVTADEDDSSKATVSVLQMSDVQETITATITNASGTYTKTIFCTAETFYGPLVNDTEHLILNENFSGYEKDDILETWSGVWGTAGVYGSTDGTDNEGNNVKIITETSNNNNNRAELVDTTSAATILVIDLGKNSEGTALDGVVKGYANVKIGSEYGTGWTLIRFYGKSNNFPNGGEILGLRAEKDGLAYRIDGSNVKTDGIENAVPLAAGSTIRLRYEIDLSAGTISVTINGKHYVTLNIGVTEIYGLQFYSSNSGSKIMSIDNIAATNEGITASALATNKLSALNALYATYAAKQPEEGEKAYTTDNWATLKAAYDSAVAGLTAATTDSAATKAAVVKLYDDAVAAMAEVETIADTALKAAKEELKEALAENFPAADYTVNTEAYEAAYNKLIAAIDAYKGIVGVTGETPTGMYADATINAAVKALTEVKTDEVELVVRKEAAKAELEEYNGGADNYTANAAEYGIAYNNAVSAIDGVTLDQFKADNGVVAAALESGKAAIDEVADDAAQLAIDKAAAIKEISDYIDVKLAGFPANKEEENKASFEENVNEILDTRTKSINAIVIGGEYANYAAAKAAVDSNVSTAKINIDTAYTAATATLEETKAAAKAAVEQMANELTAGEADNVLVRAIDDELTAIVQRINGAEDADAVTDIQTSATRNFEFVKHKISEIRRMKTYAESVIATGVITVYNEDGTTESKDLGIGMVGNAAAVEKINALVLQNRFRQLSGEGEITSADRSTQMANIYNAISEAGVADNVKIAIEQINAIATALKEASYTITVNVEGVEDVTVSYGKVLYAYDIDVSTLPDDKTIAGGKWYTNADCTNEYEFGGAIYDNLTLYARLANATRVQNSNAFDYSKIDKTGLSDNAPLDNSKFAGTVNSFLTINNVVYGEDGTTIASSPVIWRSSNNVIQNTNGGLSFTVGGAATITIGFASTGGSNESRLGLLDASGNYVAAFSLSSGLTLCTDENAGAYTMKGTSVVTIVFKVTEAGTYTINCPSDKTGRGARIAVVNVVEDYKLEHDVTVTWGSETKTYHHSEEITPPAAPAGNGEFVGWYDTTTGAKFESGSLTAGTHSFEAKFEYTVKITYNNGNENVDLYLNVTDGSAIEALLPTLAAKTEGDTVYVHSGWTIDDNDVDFSTLAVGTAANPAEYTLVAKYEASTANLVDNITISSAEDKTEINVGDTLQLTANVTLTDPDADGDTTVSWTSSDESVATVDENGVVTAVGEGTVTITATANDASGKTATITIVITKPSTVADSVDLSKDTNTSGHALNFTSEEGYFTLTSTNNFKYSSVSALGGSCLVASDKNRALNIKVDSSVESVTFTLKLALGSSSGFTSVGTGTITRPNEETRVTETVDFTPETVIFELTVTLKGGETWSLASAAHRLAVLEVTAEVIPNS